MPRRGGVSGVPVPRRGGVPCCWGRGRRRCRQGRRRYSCCSCCRDRCHIRCCWGSCRCSVCGLSCRRCGVGCRGRCCRRAARVGLTSLLSWHCLLRCPAIGWRGLDGGVAICRLLFRLLCYCCLLSIAVGQRPIGCLVCARRSHYGCCLADVTVGCCHPQLVPVAEGGCSHTAAGPLSSIRVRQDRCRGLRAVPVPLCLLQHRRLYAVPIAACRRWLLS